MRGLHAKAGLFSVALLLLAAGLSLMSTGCSSGCHDYKSSDDTKSKFCNLVIKHNISYAKALDSTISKILLSGYDANGDYKFDPAEYSRTTTITKSVPVDTRSIRLVYYNSNSEAVGVYAAGVTLVGGKDYVIEDPEWQKTSEQTYVQSIDVSALSSTTAVDDYVKCYAKANVNTAEGTYLQDITDEAVWSAVNENKVILSSKNYGNFKAIQVGVGVAQAAFMAISNQTKITVLGEDPYLNLDPANFQLSEEGSYVFPLAFNEPGYAGPILILNYDHDTKIDLRVSSSNSNVAEATIENNEGEGFEYLRLTPKAAGDTIITVTLEAKDPATGEAVTHVSKISCKIFDGELAYFVRGDKFPEVYPSDGASLPAGENAKVTIYGVFANEDESVLSTYIDMMPYISRELTGLPDVCLQENVRHTISGKIATFEYASTAEGATKVTVTVPDGYTIKEAGTLEDLGTSAACDIYVSEAVPRRLLGAWEDSEGHGDHGDSTDLRVGELLYISTELEYSDGSLENVTNDSEWTWEKAERVDVVKDETKGRYAVIGKEKGQVLITMHLNDQYEDLEFILTVR